MIKRFEDFVGTVSQLYKVIQKLKAGRMKDFGLKGPDVMCLFYLSQYRDGLTAARLCELAGMDKAAVSRILAELEQKGYVAYPTRDGSRKYRVCAVLTPRGQAVTEQIDRIICDIVEEAGEGVSESDRRAMYRALGIISCNLEKLSNETLSNKDV
ncbi:MAG: MarR family winged helix-turn-helix transcriptional regulator [Acutalibacteraceae bacterium]